MNDTKTQVWMCGGGRQSCAIAVLIIQGRIPKPDISVISDTGRERFSTFPYLNKYVIPALAQAGVILNIIEAKKWSYYGTEYVDGSGDLMLPAYTLENGVKSKNLPDCSGAWKRDAINHWLSKMHGITRSQYIKWIGFSRSPKELVRALKMDRSDKEGNGKTRFPLIELGLTTSDCLRLVTNFGWPTPKVSACWMCPNLKDEERSELSDDEQRLAHSFDEEVGRKFPEAFLHKSCQRLKEIDFKSQMELPGSEICETGHCFV